MKKYSKLYRKVIASEKFIGKEAEKIGPYCSKIFEQDVKLFWKLILEKKHIDVFDTLWRHILTTTELYKQKTEKRVFNWDLQISLII